MDEINFGSPEVGMVMSWRRNLQSSWADFQGCEGAVCGARALLQHMQAARSLISRKAKITCELQDKVVI